uniref:Uncharacterized protein n=1 Tax=Oryza punctata TaxID=4537 RepID=A0A0E0JJ72_ORYPU
MAARRRVPFFVQSAARRASPSDVLRLLIVTSSFPGGGGWNLTTPESGLLRTRPETSTLRRMNGSRECSDLGGASMSGGL